MPVDIMILHNVPKIITIFYTVPDVWCVTGVIIIFHFGQLLHFYPSNSPKNENFKTLKKAPGDIIILHKCTKNHDICYTVPEIYGA